MFPHETALDLNKYRLVLVMSGSRAIWTNRVDGALRLPRITIPRWMRPAEQLQLLIKADWGLRAIVLDVLPSKVDSAHCAIVEIMSSRAHTGLVAASIDEVVDADIASDERETVRAILFGNGNARGPFSRIGWVEDAMAWMRAEVGHEIRFTGEIRQLNASGSFALARFSTQTGPAYWLKATGEASTHEFHITKMLAGLCTEFLPRRIAERGNWNAWLMEDAGRPVEVWTLPALEQAASSMAKLQIKTIGRTEAFLDAGAIDHRETVLRAHLVELVEYLNEAMMKQTSTRVPRIGRRRLLQLAAIAEDACCCMEALGIPDTLLHGDTNSGNILFEGTHCVFTDWCETGVGNPFFTLQYLCLLGTRGEDGWTPRLQETYTRCWLDCLTSRQIDRAFALLPLLAILSHLYGRGTWLHSAVRNEDHVESYSRGLARHMDRAAQDPRLLEALCH